MRSAQVRNSVGVMEVDSEALAANMRAVRGMVGPDCRIFAVVKADGYGFGALESGRIFLKNGADALGVEDLALALQLRQNRIEVPILLYPCTDATDTRAIIEHKLTPVVDTEAFARSLSSCVSNKLDVFLRVDVGRRGSGVVLEALLEFARRVATLPGIQIVGLCAHVQSGCSAEDATAQLDAFNKACASLAELDEPIRWRLIAASPILMQSPDTKYNAVDPGRMLYGLIGGQDRSPIELLPAFRSLKTRLIAVHEVPAVAKGEADRRVGLVPLGLSDGIERAHCGAMLVHGKLAPLVGKPSLEHCQLDLTGIPAAREGDEVIVLGRQGQAEITIVDVLNHQQKNPNGLAIALGKRIYRCYVGNT